MVFTTRSPAPSLEHAQRGDQRGDQRRTGRPEAHRSPNFAPTLTVVLYATCRDAGPN
jgi:hypothetical protein